jgi:hypothetical protein
MRDAATQRGGDGHHRVRQMNRKLANFLQQAFRRVNQPLRTRFVDWRILKRCPLEYGDHRACNLIACRRQLLD